MQIEKISERFHVSPQITADDLVGIAAEGFKTIINNRPDGEEVGQPVASELASDAARLNIRFINVPVVAGGITNTDVNDFKRACKDIDTPILLFCRTGGRCRELLRLANLTE